MPVNVSPEYAQAEKRLLAAQTDEERVPALEELIKVVPSHKGAESLRANLRTRLKKLKEKLEKRSKRSGGSKQGIKKDPMQASIVGFPNAGKSLLFNILTNQQTLTSNIPFSTKQPVPGMMKFEDAQVQLVDMPPFPNEDKSIINTTDTLLILVTNLDQINASDKFLEKTIGKRIYLFVKTDLLKEEEKRKLEATLKSKYKNLDAILFSNINHSNPELENLKKIIFESFPVIRVYTKEPKKESTQIPMILKKNSTAKDIAEKIIKGMSKNIKKIRVWGPSSKFPGQTIGLDHILKDKDTIEFQTE